MGHCGVFWGTALAFVCALVSVKGSLAFQDEWFSNSTTNYDYKDALGKAILFFEGQKSGKLPASQRVNWRGDSALSDGKPEGVCELEFFVSKFCNLVLSKLFRFSFELKSEHKFLLL